MNMYAYLQHDKLADNIVLCDISTISSHPKDLVVVQHSILGR